MTRSADSRGPRQTRSARRPPAGVLLWFLPPRALGTLLAIGLFYGCPHRFDPAAAPALDTPDPAAARDIAAAHRLYERGRLEEADRAFALFSENHAADPLVPMAALYRGRIALDQGRLEPGRALLEPLAARPDGDAVGLKARFYLGLLAARMDQLEEAHRLLTPFLPLVEDKDLPAVLAVLAQAAIARGDPMEAARLLDRWHALAQGRPLEWAHSRRELDALVEGVLSEAQMRELLATATEGSLLQALCGTQLSALAQKAGRAEEAAQLLEKTRDARAQHLGPATVATVAAKAPRVGVLVPLAGRLQAAGEQLLQGAIEGSQALGADPADRLVLLVGDSSRDPVSEARRLVADGAAALAGTLQAAEADLVAAEAARLGVPFVSTSPPGEQARAVPNSFRLVHANSQRALALVRHAVARGRRNLAILAPQNSFGQAMTQALTRDATRLGATIVATLTYAPGLKSFSEPAKALARLSFDALVVPDMARTLALLAPALAGEGLWTQDPQASDTPAHRRSILLLSTADGLGPELASGAGRYVQGAVLAPGFFPDMLDPETGPRLLALEQSLGQRPTLLQAIGHDALVLLRARLLPAARSRAAAPRTTMASPPSGVTGRLTFTTDGARADEPLLYRVEGSQIRRLPLAQPGNP